MKNYKYEKQFNIYYNKSNIIKNNINDNFNKRKKKTKKIQR